MGLLATLLGPFADRAANSSPILLAGAGFFALISLAVVVNVMKQLLFKNPNQPPVVFHWFPLIGNTIAYGMDPIAFFKACQDKYGDVYTFVLLGKRMTVYLGTKGNDFILNGKLRDVSAEEVYNGLCAPVFGKDVVYDCPNSKLMEQKKFVKFGLTTEAFRSYVTLISDEVQAYIKKTHIFKESKGVFEVTTSMAQLTIFTASRSLQGKEVRDKFDESFADVYHDLDQGFSPINFMLPWAPLPHNRRRDVAHKKIVDTYTEIIRRRRASDTKGDTTDMIWNLMGCVYKDGTPVPDHEVAHIMIALLMAGQHSSSSTIAWIVLRLADNPHITEELLAEQKAVLGEDLPSLTYEDLSRLPLHAQVVRETLRMNAPIHSIMRKVKAPMPVADTNFVVPKGDTLMATPLFIAVSEGYFPNPQVWDPHRWDDGTGAANLMTETEDEKIDYGYGLVSKGASSPYLPFGAGRHRCIGEQFAYVQLQTILANLVRTFKFTNLPGSKGVVNTDYSSLFSRPLAPGHVQFERRDKA